MNLISYEESVKDLVKEIKQKRDGWRNLKNTYVNYSEYVSEQIDKSMSYTEYVYEQIDMSMSYYTEYTAEKIDKK
jgi:hypothetical protein